MKPLKMSPAVRILLLQIVVGTVFTILTAILVFLTLRALPLIDPAFSSIPPYFYAFILVASFYLGSLLGIKIVNAISGKKQKYALSLMAIPLLAIPSFFLLDSDEEIPTDTLILVLYLMTPTLLMIVATHTENHLRKKTMKPLKMSPAVRILLQIAVGAALGFLTGILIMLGIDALPFDEYPFNKVYEVFATHVVIASFYLGTLFGIKTVNSVSGRKQKYTLTLMTVPGFTIATFFFLEWMGEDITPLIQWLLYLVMIPGLVVLVTHLEVFLRKRYKLSRHS